MKWIRSRHRLYRNVYRGTATIRGMSRTFLIDTDTASDDAVALIMALRAPDVQVAAITVVAGNVPLEQATRNALCTAELCGSAAPASAGPARGRVGSSQ